MTAQGLVKGGLLCAAMVAFPLAATAQVPEIGKEIFQTYCALCHGADGKGDGSYVPMLTAKPTDLTMLQKNNDGVFPFEHVYEVLDGRVETAGHGTKEMPIWGNFFAYQAPEMTAPMGTQGDYESYVVGRILSVIDYLSTIQAK